mgnify:CR=1 FL=1
MAWCAWELSGLGVEDVLASSAPAPAAPGAEQHHGADQHHGVDQYTRCRQCGHDLLPSSSLSPCQSMVIRVLCPARARSAGSRMYFWIGDCAFPQTTGFCPQSSVGRRSPRGESTSSTSAHMARWSSARSLPLRVRRRGPEVRAEPPALAESGRNVQICRKGCSSALELERKPHDSAKSSAVWGMCRPLCGRFGHVLHGRYLTSGQ